MLVKDNMIAFTINYIYETHFIIEFFQIAFYGVHLTHMKTPLQTKLTVSEKNVYFFRV